MSSILNMRQGQRRFMRLVDQYRLIAFLARRQYGKTTTFGKIALRKMMKTADHTVIYGSAKIDLAREIVRNEARVLQAAITEAVAQAAAKQVQVVDAGTGRTPDVLTEDDFANLFETQRLEFRFYHSASRYSRTKVVALRPDTVGETGDLMCDEIGRVRNWREVWEAVSPIIASNPDFRCTLCTTIPPDDTHYSFDMLVPPVGTTFEANPQGNLYESDMGIKVLRVDAWDAATDGVPLYNMQTGAPESPEDNRAAESDKDAWDRNYGLKFLVGGAAACGLMQLASAQERGVGTCAHVDVQTDEDLRAALDFLAQHLGAGKVGIGWDLATTEKEKSNPSAVAVVEEVSADNYAVRLILTWKTNNPAVAEERMRFVLARLCHRVAGGRPRELDIDSTNERFFASTMQRVLANACPVRCVVGSESVEKPGYEPMTTKQYLGSLLVGILDDNHLTLPPERYIKEDFRLVKKERGLFVCTPDVQGRHGDTFDAVKLALHALKGAPPPAAPHLFDSNRRNQVVETHRDRRIFS